MPAANISGSEMTAVKGRPCAAAPAERAPERPDALLSTVGGQTTLNLSVELAEAGVLDKYGVELIGANIHAIKKAEDRLLFKDAIAANEPQPTQDQTDQPTGDEP